MVQMTRTRSWQGTPRVLNPARTIVSVSGSMTANSLNATSPRLDLPTMLCALKPLGRAVLEVGDNRKQLVRVASNAVFRLGLINVLRADDGSDSSARRKRRAHRCSWRTSFPKPPSPERMAAVFIMSQWCAFHPLTHHLFGGKVPCEGVSSLAKARFRYHPFLKIANAELARRRGARELRGRNGTTIGGAWGTTRFGKRTDLPSPRRTTGQDVGSRPDINLAPLDSRTRLRTRRAHRRWLRKLREHRRGAVHRRGHAREPDDPADPLPDDRRVQKPIGKTWTNRIARFCIVAEVATICAIGATNLLDPLNVPGRFALSVACTTCASGRHLLLASPHARIHRLGFRALRVRRPSS